MIFLSIKAFHPKKSRFVKKGKRQGNHTFLALVLCNEERDRKTSITPQRLLMQPDRHSCI